MATGDIGTIRATWEFDIAQGEPGTFVYVAGDVYAFAYGGPLGVAGQLRTVSISNTGALTPIGDLNYDTAGAFPVVIHIAGNIYAITYQGPGNDGWLRTFFISDDGLTITSINTLEFDGTYCSSSSIIHIAGNIYAIAYRGPGDDGWLRTVSISDDGVTLALTGGNLQYDDDFGDAKITHIAGNIYAIAYRGPGNDGWLRTFFISDDGLTITSINTLEYDGAQSLYQEILHIAGSVYAVAYRGPGNNGIIRTITISDDGVTLALTGGNLVFAAACIGLDFKQVAPNTFVVPYWIGPGNVGTVRTFNISDDGLTIDLIDADTFSAIALTWEGIDIIHVIGGNIYAVMWSGTLQDGYMSTIDIESRYAPFVRTEVASEVT